MNTKQEIKGRIALMEELIERYGKINYYIPINSYFDSRTKWIFNINSMQGFENVTKEYSNELKMYALNRLHNRLLSEIYEWLFVMNKIVKKADKYDRYKDIIVGKIGYDVKLTYNKSSKYIEHRYNNTMSSYFYRRYDSKYLMICYEDRYDLLKREVLIYVYKEFGRQWDLEKGKDLYIIDLEGVDC